VNRREFLQALEAAAAAGLPVNAKAALDLSSGPAFYDGLERFGNVSLLHFTDCHAQLNPVRFREPSVNLGVGAAVGRPPHLVGEALLRHFGIRPGTREAHAFTYLDYEAAARTYGELGGFAHLATLVRKLKARPGAPLPTAATRGKVTPHGRRARTWSTRRRCLNDVTTAHWESRQAPIWPGDRGQGEPADRFTGQIIKTADFGDPVFRPHASGRWAVRRSPSPGRPSVHNSVNPRYCS
jgi:sulfur-oxidizing protein SoxB